jgi:hypothetical protein
MASDGRIRKVRESDFRNATFQRSDVRRERRNEVPWMPFV